jgi:hypothetical protein
VYRKERRGEGESTIYVYSSDLWAERQVPTYLPSEGALGAVELFFYILVGRSSSSSSIGVCFKNIVFLYRSPLSSFAWNLMFCSNVGLTNISILLLMVSLHTNYFLT